MRIESINCPECGTEMQFRDTRQGPEFWFCPACGENLDPSYYDDEELRNMGAVLESDETPQNAPESG